MKTTLLLCLFFLCNLNFAQTSKYKKFQVAFYNLENLFDTINDKGKEDYEYLPTSQKKWNTAKYHDKLNHLSRAIANIGDWEGPDLLGVCEIEHKSCLEDLINKTSLKQFNYGIIHQESNDNRGIDVACIYKKEKIKVIDYQYHRINFGKESRPTRDILYIKGVLNNKDTLHYFANHWPSRYGGASASQPKRMKVANTLRSKIDSIFDLNPYSNIIINGDFNDGTTDLSITKNLKAKFDTSNLATPYLFNTSYRLQSDKKLGTHKYHDEWNLFDQTIISSSLLDSNRTLFCKAPDSKIHGEKEWLNEADNLTLGHKPYRSYYGHKYNGGYSDHYAISILLWYKY